MTLSCQPRSAAWLTATVAARMVETAPRYRAGQIDGGASPGATWCNLFVADVTADLGAPVPWLLANEQLDWLGGGLARKEGWERVGTEEALAAVARGEVVVVGWRNPGGHGHIAVGVPGPDGLGLHVAQAGARNFTRKPVSSGFGTHPVLLWRHP